MGSEFEAGENRVEENVPDEKLENSVRNTGDEEEEEQEHGDEYGDEGDAPNEEDGLIGESMEDGMSDGNASEVVEDEEVEDHAHDDDDDDGNEGDPEGAEFSDHEVEDEVNDEDEQLEETEVDYEEEPGEVEEEEYIETEGEDNDDDDDDANSEDEVEEEETRQKSDLDSIRTDEAHVGVGSNAPESDILRDHPHSPDPQFFGQSQHDGFCDEHGTEIGSTTSLGEIIFDQYCQAFEEHEMYVSTVQQLQLQVARLLKRKRSITKQSSHSMTESDASEEGRQHAHIADVNEQYKTYVEEHMKQRRELEEQRMSNENELANARMEVGEKIDRRAADEEVFRMLRLQAAAQSESAGTGRPLDMEHVKRVIEQERLKDVELRELRKKYIRTRNMVSIMEAKVREKEEPSKGLHIIDFEQLKMENSTFSEKIEEKNEALLKSKLKSTMIVHILSHVREKLYHVGSEELEYARQLKELGDELAKHKDLLSQLKRERDALREKNSTMRELMPLVSSDKLLFDYESRRTEKIQHLTRKTELQEQYQRAQDKANVYQSIVDNHNQLHVQALLAEQSNRHPRVPTFLRHRK